MKNIDNDNLKESIEHKITSEYEEKIEAILENLKTRDLKKNVDREDCDGVISLSINPNRKVSSKKKTKELLDKSIASSKFGTIERFNQSHFMSKDLSPLIQQECNNEDSDISRLSCS